MRKRIDCNCTEKWRGHAPTILRIATGLVFLMHGWQKLQGGVSNVAGFLSQIGFPSPELFAVLLIAGELGGGILLILGLFTHWAAKVTAFIALVALVTVHITHGFFLAGGGYEYIMMLLAASISIMLTGPGKWSFDQYPKQP